MHAVNRCGLFFLKFGTSLVICISLMLPVFAEDKASPAQVLNIADSTAIQSVWINHDWSTVTTNNLLNQATTVNFFSAPSSIGGERGVVRMRRSNGALQLRFQEWANLDGTHVKERVSLLGLTKGWFESATAQMEVDTVSLSSTTSWKTIEFSKAFVQPPAVILALQSANGGDAVSARVRRITRSSMQVRLFEEDKKSGTPHVVEQLGYLLIHSQNNPFKTSDGTLVSLPFGGTGRQMHHDWVDIVEGVQNRLEEDQTLDEEVSHVDETIHVVEFGPLVLTQLSSDRGYDNAVIRALSAHIEPRIRKQQSIAALVADKACDTNEQCQLISYGAQACGGLKSSLLYSTRQTDAKTLVDLVEQYNEIDRLYQAKESIVSTCEVTPTPVAACIESECNAFLSEEQLPTPAPTIPETETQPNILLIISDDQGLDASAQYALSHDVPNTPVMNQLAKDGIIFDNAWATPACATTRASLITGKHGINSGVTFVPAKLDTSTEIIQTHLKNNAATSQYSSAVFGKWHLGGGNSSDTHPNDLGIEYFAGNIQGNLDSYFDWNLTINGVNSNSKDYHTIKMVDLSIDWINQQTTPWFAWLAFSAPHAPFHLPPQALHSRNLSGTEEDIADNRRHYFLAAIEAMDTEIGRLLDAIPAQQRANTVIIFLSDNGTPRPIIDTNAFVRSHGKNTLYEGGIQVPMFISGKGVSRHNEREAALINTTDLFATIAELAGAGGDTIHNSMSFAGLLTYPDAAQREYNYSEFQSENVNGWTVRNAQYKFIQFDDGSQELYDLNADRMESNNLLPGNTAIQTVVNTLQQYGFSIRGTTIEPEPEPDNNPQTPTPDPSLPVDISNQILTARNANCADYVNAYTSSVTDVHNNRAFTGNMTIEIDNNKCVFTTNVIPNHDFNDGARAFPNHVSEQNNCFEVSTKPTAALETTALSLTLDNAILLNGVKVDLLAAACFGVGNERVGCNDISQAWRFDPMHAENGFRVDSHNAHSQPDGSYHYHGDPNALFDVNSHSPSPVVGFAADGYPIFGSLFNDNGTVRPAHSSYQLKTGARADIAGSPGGNYDGTYRDDYQYIPSSGDLDECNGMIVDGVYAYYITQQYPYILGCFKGTPDPSFNKRR